MSESLNPSLDDFAEMFEASVVGKQSFEDTVVKGTVTGIEKDMAIIDVGLKMEGRVPLREFTMPGQEHGLSVGDTVEVYVERVENALGEAVISREKARREEAWARLEGNFEAEDRVDGVIFNRVKGGFTVDLDGAVAFLPGSQVDIRPVRDAAPLMNITQPFKILKMDKRRGNIVVSRRAILEEDRAEHRQEVVKDLTEGDQREGIVKNITDYGAFVELAPGVDGLLHVTDMSWSRVNHPSEVINVNDTVQVQIIKINPETHRISLGMKQLAPDPWEGVAAKYPLDARFKGKVTNITDYGAFVELEDGIEGLVHVSEMSWVKKNVHPGKIVATSQEVDVMVLEVDETKRRISLGLKQCADNPWENFAEQHPVDSIVEGEIKNITEFGLFVGITDDMDGMVHLSDLDWDKSGDEAIKDYEKGQVVKAKILDVDPNKERISLSIKHLDGDPMDHAGDIRRGADVT
ncbi:MAG: 30S ribosomal protein S1, partial [Parvularculaceae bacterium]